MTDKTPTHQAKYTPSGFGDYLVLPQNVYIGHKPSRQESLFQMYISTGSGLKAWGSLKLEGQIYRKELNEAAAESEDGLVYIVQIPNAQRMMSVCPESRFTADEENAE